MTTSGAPAGAAADWSAARGEKWLAGLSGMEGMLAPVDEPLIEALRLEAPFRIAEIGCGGGGTALEILRRAPAGSVVHGFDVSPALVDVARRRIGPAQPALSFETADMATAAPPREPYDRLVSRFGIMFFDDAPAAFANLSRWLVPGGRFAFAAWGPTADNPWMTSVRDAAAEAVEIPSPDPEAPGAFRYSEADRLLTLLGRAGFGELDVRDWRGLLPLGGGLPAAEAATFALATFASFGELLAKAGDEALNHARQSLTARFARHQQDGVVRLDARVHLFTGARLG
ncbi:MAG TPA: class I SAM-dependent methyltransferase [Polyangia bacterium]|nr:class I SAM-dependent methyltransferase [Polyangia bacterium]